MLNPFPQFTHLMPPKYSKVHAYHSSIGLPVGATDLPSPHQVQPGSPAEPALLAASPTPGPSRTTHDDDILAMLSDEIIHLPSEPIPRASSSDPSSSIRVQVNADPSQSAMPPTPPPRSLSAPTSLGFLPNMPEMQVSFNPRPATGLGRHPPPEIFYNHIPGTSLLDDEPPNQWRIEETLRMWSAQGRFA